MTGVMSDHLQVAMHHRVVSCDWVECIDCAHSVDLHSQYFAQLEFTPIIFVACIDHSCECAVGSSGHI